LVINLVYKNLPKGVLEELKERTPRTAGGYPKYNLHRSLTETGREALKKVIYTVEALASISKNKNTFLKLVKEKYKLEKEFPYIDADAMDDKGKETDFDKMLDICLNTPPIKK
jgi:hypothetical protein